MAFLTSATQTRPGRDSGLERQLAGIAARDRDALAALYRDTRTAVYGFALSILKNVHDAEDVLHDCYVSIWQAAPGYRPDGKAMAWILTIARNLCLQRLRERARHPEADIEDWEPALAAQDSLQLDEKLTLAACMRSLSAEERQIVMLHAAAGFRHREIAEMLELPLSTVLSKYHRARNKMKKHLEGEWNA